MRNRVTLVPTVLGGSAYECVVNGLNLDELQASRMHSHEDRGNETE